MRSKLLMAAIHLLALLAVTGGAEQVQGQSSKRMQQVTRGQVLDNMRQMDMSAGGNSSSSSEVIGRQGRASRGRQSRQSCTAKTGMSFTRCYLIINHLTTCNFSLNMRSISNPTVLGHAL